MLTEWDYRFNNKRFVPHNFEGTRKNTHSWPSNQLDSNPQNAFTPTSFGLVLQIYQFDLDLILVRQKGVVFFGSNKPWCGSFPVRDSFFGMVMDSRTNYRKFHLVIFIFFLFICGKLDVLCQTHTYLQTKR